MRNSYIIITPFFPTKESFRGPFIYDQAKAIKDLGDYEVVVFKPKIWYSTAEDYIFEGIKVYQFKTYDLPSYIFPGLFDFLSNYSLKKKLKKENIKIQNIEFVHSHVTRQGSFARFLKKLNGNVTTILQHHGFDVLSLENGFLRNFRWHRKWVENDGVSICNHIDINVGVSKKTLDYFEFFKKIQFKQTYVLYNGVDKTKFYPIPDLKNENLFTIGCIANFWPLKDQITLLKTAKKIITEKRIQNVHLKFIGTGETLDICKQFVVENHLDKYVEFIESLPHDQLVYFYNSLDLFVLPSYWEAFGCVYTEAHECGVPFIGVKDQGIGEIIREENRASQLIEKSDTESLAILIIDYYEKKLGHKPLAINLDILVTMDKFLNFISRDTSN